MRRQNPLYTDAYIGDRWKEILRLFDLFKTDYVDENDSSVTLSIDEIALYQAVASYFHDVARYKWWHFTDPGNHLIDDTKKAAYMVYWLNKLQPICVERSTKSPAELAALLQNDTSVLVNSQFALTVAYSYLNLVLSDDIAEQFLYLLTYRATDPNALILIFQIVSHVKASIPIIM